MTGSVIWDGYGSIRGVSGTPFRDLTRKQARANYVLIMEKLPERVEKFSAWLTRNGQPVPTSLDQFVPTMQWICDNTELDPDDDTYLDAKWAAVAFDGALLLGELFRTEYPSLQWKLRTTGGKLSIGWHAPVLEGFHNSPVPNKAYSPIRETADTMIGYKRMGGDGRRSYERFVGYLKNMRSWV